MKSFDPEINFGNVWNTPKCYYCGKDYPLDCWYVFERIGGRVYQVPACNECADKKFREMQNIKKAE